MVIPVAVFTSQDAKLLPHGREPVLYASWSDSESGHGMLHQAVSDTRGEFCRVPRTRAQSTVAPSPVVQVGDVRVIAVAAAFRH